MESPIISHIRMVLVGTTHPGNIGAVARSMKTMGITNLYLVGPRTFPSAEATARAAGADDILERATECGSLYQAVQDCALTFATSARERSIAWPEVSPPEAAAQAVETAGGQENVAFVFGRESSGLTNKELDVCNRMISIPCNPGFSSLNLAAAVQIICYELFNALYDRSGVSGPGTGEHQPVTTEEMTYFYEQLESSLIEIGYLDPDKPRRLMRRMRRLFNRVNLDRNEYNILRGILAAIREQCGSNRKQ